MTRMQHFRTGASVREAPAPGHRIHCGRAGRSD
jgi:hypothetical protein